MGNNVEGRVARLERAIASGLGIDLAEHDDPDQAAARAKQAEADAKAGEEANAAAAAELVAPPVPDEAYSPEGEGV